MNDALKPPYACVVFDLDGTLLDTRTGMLLAINTVLARHGIAAVQAAQLAEVLHFGLEAMLVRALAVAGSDVDSDQLQIETQRCYLESAAQSVSLFDGARELLGALQQSGCWLALCTNQSQANAQGLLRCFALDGYFREVIGADTLQRRKPDPAPMRWLMQQAGAAPQATLMVGDSEVDRSFAVAAGVDVVLMAHGYGLADVQLPCPQRPDFSTLAAELLR